MAIVWVPSACPSPGVILAQHTAALSFWCCMKQMVLSLACSGLESTLEQLEVGLNEAGNRLQAEDLCLARKDPSLLGAGRVRSGLPLPSSCPKKNNSFLFHTCQQFWFGSLFYLVTTWKLRTVQSPQIWLFDARGQSHRVMEWFTWAVGKGNKTSPEPKTRQESGG